MAFYRQSKRRTAHFLSALLGQPCCPSLTVKIQKQVTTAVRPSYEALAAQLPAQGPLSIDETGTKEANGAAWLWTFVARMFTEFVVRATREATALTAFLAEPNTMRSRMKLGIDISTNEPETAFNALN